MRMKSTAFGALASNDSSLAKGLRYPIRRQTLRPLGWALTRPALREARRPATTPSTATRFARLRCRRLVGAKKSGRFPQRKRIAQAKSPPTGTTGFASRVGRAARAKRAAGWRRGWWRAVALPA